MKKLLCIISLCSSVAYTANINNLSLRFLYNSMMSPCFTIGYELKISDYLSMRANAGVMPFIAGGDFDIGINIYPFGDLQYLYIGIAPSALFKTVGGTYFSAGVLPEVGYKFAFNKDGGLYITGFIGCKISIMYWASYDTYTGNNARTLITKINIEPSAGVSIGYAF